MGRGGSWWRVSLAHSSTQFSHLEASLTPASSYHPWVLTMGVPLPLPWQDVQRQTALTARMAHLSPHGVCAAAPNWSCRDLCGPGLVATRQPGAAFGTWVGSHCLSVHNLCFSSLAPQAPGSHSLADLASMEHVPSGVHFCGGGAPKRPLCSPSFLEGHLTAKPSLPT